MIRADRPGELEQSVPGLADIEAGYRLHRVEEPPSLVDQSVLNLARRELVAGRQQRRKAIRWVGALATVSLLVLTLTVVVQQHNAMQPPAPPAGQANFKAAKDQDLPATEPAASEVADVAAQSPAKSSARARDELNVTREEKAAALSSVDSNSATRPEQVSDPEAWLQRILRLQQEGEIEQATSELNSFRQAYPDYPLPESLLD